MPFKLGCKPRAHRAEMPHMSALLMRAGAQTPISDYAHYADVLPADVGMFENDRLGCCTCAAVYHALQVWERFAQGRLDSISDSMVVNLYRRFGYDGTPMTDHGAVEQDVLASWVSQGVPFPSRQTDKLVAPIEIDPRNIDDMQRGVYECGVAYVGFSVPAGLMEAMPDVWDESPGYGSSVGNHAVILTGYSKADHTFDLISWGRKFKMTEAFWQRYGAEAYALCDRQWVEANGKTPLGMTIDELAQQAAGLRRIG